MSMNPFDEHRLLLADPLSPHTRSVRKSLLISSLVSIAIARTQFFPTKISALGIEFTQANRGSMIFLLVVVVSFLFISFIATSASDFMYWRVGVWSQSWADMKEIFEQAKKDAVEGKDLTEELKGRLAELDRSIGSEWRNAKHLERYTRSERLASLVSWLRLAVEFLFPLLAGVAAIWVLLVT